LDLPNYKVKDLGVGLCWIGTILFGKSLVTIDGNLSLSFSNQYNCH